MQKFIVAQNLCKRFAGVQALKDVSITINRGEIRCLAGENGSGKSTFIKLIAGIHKPDSGQIIIDGKNYKNLHPIDAIREGVQVIYQDFSLFPNLTVAENLALNTQLEQRRWLVNQREVNRIAASALAQLNVEIDLRKTIEELPVAQKQLVAISRTLLHDARLIIMDEPTTALTRKEVDALFQIIKRLQRDGISVLFVSHKLKEVMEISDCITILRNGQKVAEGATSSFDSAKIAYHTTGKEFTRITDSRKKEISGAKPLLRLENLGKAGAFRSINLSLATGEILGIVGLLGSGRTELALALFGMNSPDSGQIYIDETPVRIQTVQEALSHSIAYVPEDRLREGLFLEQSIGRNIFISILDSLLTRFGLIHSRKAHDIAQRWMSELNIVAAAPHSPAKSLSGGNQQKVVLARWLAATARLLILNGPTVGVDVGAKMEIHDKIRDLAHKGIGILMISDDLPEIIRTCDRILIMHRGQIVENLLTADCDENRLIHLMSQLK
ncbi:sugar ABC transporter ATP-binding protein [candidate division KSB1 bacterium]|nr:sugar ABC transporter ATP-binding protein [candidate division KSB1 bacterium]